ncbi:DUF6348 family protein [Chitinophaga sedimenti]|uniref:DUF6348 family protein n=1 Tax=Chitinophaga sedimenti TaxID=2033606 RepID=UPI002003A1BE|nr:DUF6348 family protein [Chitinophaga sedimenti]MCK7553752.1 DUF6348 family protein [Chitinophaga sedimenti]
MLPDQYLLQALARRLMAQGYLIDIATTGYQLTVSGALDITTSIIDSPDYHPSLIHLLITTKNADYFPEGIIENIVGVGNTLEEKVETVLDNYLATTFPAIADSFLDGHDPEVDFNDARGVLWHPRIGALSLQGQWEAEPAGEPIFDLLKTRLAGMLPDRKLNWLKVYVARYQDNEIIAECLLNNEVWPEGVAAVRAYAAGWAQVGTFLGQKQFMMFRRCDAFDAVNV